MLNYISFIILSMDSKQSLSVEETPITLNIGGKKYETLRSTLITYPDTLLGRMFTSCKDMTKDKNEFFFDRDGELFTYILNYYRNGFIDYPYNVPINTFCAELQFWGISSPFEIDGELLRQCSRLNSQDSDILCSYQSHYMAPTNYIEEICRKMIKSLNNNIEDYKAEPEKYIDPEKLIKNSENDIKYYQRLIDIQKANAKPFTRDTDEVRKIKNAEKQIGSLSTALYYQIDDLKKKREILHMISNGFRKRKKLDIKLPQTWTTKKFKQEFDKNHENVRDKKRIIHGHQLFMEENAVHVLLKNCYDSSREVEVKDLRDYDLEVYLTWVNIVSADNIKIKKANLQTDRLDKSKHLHSYGDFYPTDPYGVINLPGLVDMEFIHESRYRDDVFDHCRTFVKENDTHKLYNIYYLEISFRDKDENL